MNEKYNTLFLLFQEVEALSREIDNGRVEYMDMWCEASQQISDIIDEIIEDNPRLKFHGSNVVMEAFKIVYQTL